MKYYNKYMNYKIKNEKIEHLLKIKNMVGGNKFQCNPQNNFDDICQENINGQYKSKDSCINDCENKFIDNQLEKINLKKETRKFYTFIKDLIKKEKMTVYIKGGNALGLHVLKILCKKYGNTEKYQKKFDSFLLLDLVKDWDFAAYTDKEITPEYRKKLDKLARKHHLHQRASTFILYQTRQPIMTDDKALFEISVLEKKDNYTELEIPMTTMKIKINENNIKYIFMFAVSFMDDIKHINLNLVKRMTDKLSVVIHPNKNGFYNFTDHFDDGELSKELVDIAKIFKKYDNNLPQFLITHIKDAFRILYRLPEKNLIKTDKIKSFLENDLHCKNNDWILDTNFVRLQIDEFTKLIGKKINSIYDQTNSLDKVQEFFINVRFMPRVECDFKLFSTTGVLLLNNMFKQLLTKIDTNQIDQFDTSVKFYKLLKFLKSIL